VRSPELSRLLELPHLRIDLLELFFDDPVNSLEVLFKALAFRRVSSMASEETSSVPLRWLDGIRDFYRDLREAPWSHI